jgi:hypothetical protein
VLKLLKWLLKCVIGFSVATTARATRDAMQAHPGIVNLDYQPTVPIQTQPFSKPRRASSNIREPRTGRTALFPSSIAIRSTIGSTIGCCVASQPPSSTWSHHHRPHRRCTAAAATTAVTAAASACRHPPPLRIQRVVCDPKSTHLRTHTANERMVYTVHDRLVCKHYTV